MCRYSVILARLGKHNGPAPRAALKKWHACAQGSVTWSTLLNDTHSIHAQVQKHPQWSYLLWHEHELESRKFCARRECPLEATPRLTVGPTQVWDELHVLQPGSGAF